MTNDATLCLVFHSHQPVGERDAVMEKAFQDRDRRLLALMEDFETLRFVLHTSGPVMHWISEHHPDHFDRLRFLVETGRIEILGGGHFEPILPMLPRRDRDGQVKSFRHYVQQNFGSAPRGAWIAEGTWEPGLASDLATAGIEYAVIGDVDSRAHGLQSRVPSGPVLAEDTGQMIRVFAAKDLSGDHASGRSVDATMASFRKAAELSPGAVVTLVDKGVASAGASSNNGPAEHDGWLRELLTALVKNSDRLATATLGEVVDSRPPVGRASLSNSDLGSSRGCDATAELEATTPAVRTGFWRESLVRHPEAYELYSRMIFVSNRLADAVSAGGDAGELAEARLHLYRGQCNTAYCEPSPRDTATTRNVTSGVSSAHLRSAAYRELIVAETLIDRALGGGEGRLDTTVGDFNFDGANEVRICNDMLAGWIAPATGGQMYGLDIRKISHNLMATFRRPQPSAGHQADGIRRDSGADTSSPGGPCSAASVVTSTATRGYDKHARHSLMDRFYDNDVCLDEVIGGTAGERGDFIEQPFTAKLHRSEDQIQLRMTRQGRVWDSVSTLTKAVTMTRGSETLGFTYLFEGLPPGLPLHFAVELNFAGLPANSEDRYFRDQDGNRLGGLGDTLDLRQVHGIGLSDRWLGVDLSLKIDRPSGVWAFPVCTPASGESESELIQQSVCVQPHWIIAGDDHGRWSVQFEMDAVCEVVDLAPQSLTSVVL